MQTPSTQVTDVTILRQSVQNSVSAAGTSQATATQLYSGVTAVTTATAGQGVALPPGVGQAGAYSLQGTSLTVLNQTAVSILVYPANGSGDTINGGSTTAPVTIPPGGFAIFSGGAQGYPTAKTVNWYSNINGGSAGPLGDTPSVIVAAAGSNSQSGSTAVTPGVIIVGPVSVSSRGIRLSVKGSNLSYQVFNDSAVNLNVYPATNVTIAGAATNVKVVIAARKGELFFYKNAVHIVVMGAGGV